MEYSTLGLYWELHLGVQLLRDPDYMTISLAVSEAGQQVMLCSWPAFLTGGGY